LAGTAAGGVMGMESGYILLYNVSLYDVLNTFLFPSGHFHVVIL